MSNAPEDSSEENPQDLAEEDTHKLMPTLPMRRESAAAVVSTPEEARNQSMLLEAGELWIGNFYSDTYVVILLRFNFIFYFF